MVLHIDDGGREWGINPPKNDSMKILQLSPWRVNQVNREPVIECRIFIGDL
jgi:hypothetical protein